jgi:tight adherence protein B
MQPIDILILIGLIVLALVLHSVFGGGKERKQMQKRIEQLRARSLPPAKIAEMSLRRKNNTPQGLLYLLIKPLPDFKSLENKLERTGKGITPKQYVLRRVIIVLLCVMIIAGLFKKSFFLAVFVGLMVGIWLPLKLLDMNIAKQNKAFLQLFPDAIDLIVRGLRSGLPVSESIVLVSHEVPEPVGGVFLNISNTMKLGVSLEKALQETARKLNMTEFNFFTTSIILQRETGGNLSEILNNLSEVLRARILMRMKIKAMSSEARASAIIIGALPFVVIIAVGVMSPDYMSVLYTDPRGNVAAMIAAGMMGFGLWVMNKMTKFEI